MHVSQIEKCYLTQGSRWKVSRVRRSKEPQPLCLVRIELECVSPHYNPPSTQALEQDINITWVVWFEMYNWGIILYP